ncbi:hypothetical protein chiPu_0028172, partial [Chiloscyllium punctatum]|nr:hypothetical protein [Chiloscyllium punctatum]
MPKGKGAGNQQRGGHPPAAPATPEPAAAAASREPFGDLTDSQELAAAMERLSLKVVAAIEEIRGEIRDQVQPIASILQKHEQEIQDLVEGLEEVEGGTKVSKAAMQSSSNQ